MNHRRTVIKIRTRPYRPLSRYRARQMRAHLIDVVRGIALMIVSIGSVAAAPFVLSILSRGHL